MARPPIILLLGVIWGISQCADAGCPTFWTQWGNHCYRYFGREVSWTEAVKTCRQFNSPGSRGFADLVSIHSQDEHDFLYSYWESLRHYDSRQYKPGMWIGLTDFHNGEEQNGSQRWSDGTALDYTNFDNGQQAAGQYYYMMWDWTDSTWDPRGRWHDVGDSSAWHFQFMCKMA